MKKILMKINKWIDFNLGWFLTNGQEYKQERYRQYMMDKYPDEFKRLQEEDKNKKN